MNPTLNSNPSSDTKIFRKSFIFPLVGIIIVLSFYTLFFFEMHLKYIIQRSLFESLGTEINISKLKIRPFKESIELKKIEFTDPDKPIQNIFELESIFVSYNTKKLLDLSFQSEKTEIKNIRFHTKRKRKGRVLSKDKRVLVLKDPSTHKVTDHLKEKFNSNTFLNITKSLKGNLSKKELEELSKKFSSKKLYDKIDADREELKKEIAVFKENLKSEEVKALLNEIKNFKFNSDSSEETFSSTSKGLALIKKAEKTKKNLKSQIKEIKYKISKASENALKAPDLLEQDLLAIKKDYNSLDPSVLSEELFGEYFSLQLSKISRVKTSMTNSAINEVKKNSSIDLKKHLEESDSTPVTKTSNNEDPLSRSNIEKERQLLINKKGRWFNFKKNTPPKYWLKKILISSKASEGQDLGDLNGEISNVTSDPAIIKLPLLFDIQGSAPKQDIGSFLIKGLLDKIDPSNPTEKFEVKIADYKVKDFEVFKDDDAFLNYQESQAKTLATLNQKGDQINISIEQTLLPSISSFGSKNKTVKKILSEISTLSPLKIKLNATGSLNNPKIKVSSNIASKILSSIQNTGTNLAKDKLNKEVQKLKSDFLKDYLPAAERNNAELNNESASLDSQLDSLFDKETQKIKSKISSDKKEKIDKLKDKLFKKLKL